MMKRLSRLVMATLLIVVGYGALINMDKEVISIACKNTSPESPGSAKFYLKIEKFSRFQIGSNDGFVYFEADDGKSAFFSNLRANHIWMFDDSVGSESVPFGHFSTISKKATVFFRQDLSYKGQCIMQKGIG